MQSPSGRQGGGLRGGISAALGKVGRGGGGPGLRFMAERQSMIVCVVPGGITPDTVSPLGVCVCDVGGCTEQI